MAKVRIPTPLRKLTNDEELIEVNANNVAGAIVELQSRFPGIKERLVDETGAIRRFVNVYVNELNEHPASSRWVRVPKGRNDNNPAF